MTHKIVHLSLSVRGALKRPLRELNYFNDENGRQLTPSEAREELLQALSEGKEVLPVGDCDQFDFKTGCPGHEVLNER